MNLRFHIAAVVMMSHTLTAIISKSVTQKHLGINQTTVITAYLYFYLATLSIAIRKIERLWCEIVSVSVELWWNVSVEHWWRMSVEHWWSVRVEHLWNVSVEHWWSVSVERWWNMSLERWWNDTGWENENTVVIILQCPHWPPHYQYNEALFP